MHKAGREDRERQIEKRLRAENVKKKEQKQQKRMTAKRCAYSKRLT